MKLSDTNSGSNKFILGVAGVGLLLTLACGTSAAPADPFSIGEGNAPAQMSEEQAARFAECGANSDSMTATESSAEGADSASVPAESGATAETAIETAPELAMNLVPVGNNVGERVPDFAITLVDGSTVTSADLLTQRQPTFLFFFETW